MFTLFTAILSCLFTGLLPLGANGLLQTHSGYRVTIIKKTKTKKTASYIRKYRPNWPRCPFSENVQLLLFAKPSTILARDVKEVKE